MKLTIKTPADLQGEAVAALKDEITQAIDQYVENQALVLQYNSSAHLASYVSSTNLSWATEAQTFVTWRDEVWTVALGILSDAQQTGQLPTVYDAIAALPEWPADVQ